MEHRNFPIQDQQGNALPAASAFVYEPGTTTQVAVYDDDGNPLTQPLRPSPLGVLSFAAANGVYDIVVVNDSSVVRYEGEKFLDVDDEIAAVNQAVEDAQGYATDAQNALPFDSVSALLASTRTALGVGSIWRAADKMFLEADPAAVDHEYTTAQGVKLYDLHKRTAPAMSYWSSALGDGDNLLDIDGLAYERDSSATGASSATNDLGVDGFVPLGVLNVGHFGAAIGATEAVNTAAFQAAIDFSLIERTGFDGFSSYGTREIYIPKGRYSVGALTFGSSAIGFAFVGEGKHVTAIEYASDSGSFITANTFISFELRDLTVRHVAQNVDKTTWANSFFTSNGTSGGRQLNLVNVAVYGFNRQIENLGTVNFDTTRAERCDFYYGGSFYYGRNAQSVANTFEHCSFFQLDALMDVAGVGNTQFIGCNIVIDGPWLKLYGASGFYGPNSTYVFDGCKGEPWNGGHSYGGGARTGLVQLYGSVSLITALVKFRDCGFVSSLSLDPSTDYPQIEVTPNMRVEFDGGMLDDECKIKLHPVTISATGNKDQHQGVFFSGLRQAPDPDQITYVTSVSTSTVYPQVTWEECRYLPNLTTAFKATSASALSFPATIDRAEQTNCLNSGTAAYGVLTFGANMTHTLDFYSHAQEVIDVAVSLTYKSGGADLKIETSLDDFSTVLDTFYVKGTSGAFRFPVKKASEPVVGSKAHDWASLADGAQQSTTVTVLGVRVGDEVLSVGMSVALSGTRLWGEVTADDTVTVYQRNDTGGAVDVASGTLSATVQRKNTAVGQVSDNNLTVRCSGPGAYGHIYATVRAA